MKRSILFSLAIFSLIACKKETKILPKLALANPVATVNSDTIGDKAALKLKLMKDNVNTDETMLLFNHSSRLGYFNNEDAPYLAGFGQVSLASISSDGVDLAVNALPYKPGTSIGLDVCTKTDGTYFLKLSYQSKIPANICMWIKDNYMKDSVDLRKSDYTFNVIKGDTNSFGHRRFVLILRDSTQTNPGR